jgi:sucrose-6-phosphate hydrolase SacC (GH32 family)
MARDPDWPVYHLTAPMGWISDPNGAIYYRGKYHLFYQHNPVQKGRSERWGHVVSEDLVHWKDWPIAIWPDSPFDRTAAFSGNIVIDDRGVPTALYTGNDNHRDALGVRARSTDGMIFFGDKKAVMDKPPYPGTPVHWDGQTWKDGDTWFQLCGGTYEGGGAAVLWSSPDLDQWTFRSRIFASKKYGGFWEFPYLVPFGEKHVLMIGVWPVRYWVGTYDKKTMTFRPDDEEHPRLLDHANPYHCMNPSTVDDKGPGSAPRRIIHACIFGFPEELMSTRSKEVPRWIGMHVLPRVIKLEGDRLWQEPVPELQSLRGRRTGRRDWPLAAGKTERVEDFSSDSFEAIAEFAPGTAKRFGLRLRLSDDSRECVEVFVDPAANTFGAKGHFGEKTGPAHLKPGEPVRMQVFVDRSIVEVYCNGETLSQRFFADPKSLGVAAFAQEGTASLKSLDLWQMNSMWLPGKEAR